MAKAVSATPTPVVEQPDEQIDRRLHREMEARVSYFAQHPDEIEERLVELEAEWDIERVLQANAAGVSLFGLLMARHHYKWLVLALAAAGFLLQHAIQGWCPPAEILRRAGFRTAKEINNERTALKVLRGDFDESDASRKGGPHAKAERALQATGGDGIVHRRRQRG